MNRPRLRIAAGAYKGRPLQVPPSARPTEARVREALFSIWQDDIEGCRFLDLFAGSGAVGLEALSRGAEHAVFVESDRRAARTLLRNVEHFQLSRGAFDFRSEPVSEAVARLIGEGARFDRVFADPPYSWGVPPGFLDDVARLLAEHGQFALERGAGSPLPSDAENLVRVDQRRYGGSVLLFYART